MKKQRFFSDINMDTDLVSIKDMAQTRWPHTIVLLRSLPEKKFAVDTLADRLAKASVVFFGEERDDPVAHALELAVLKRLYLHWHGAMALSMEMFQNRYTAHC